MIAKALRQAPAFRTLRHAIGRRLSPLGEDRFLQFAPPGHFYSPIPDLAAVERRGDELFDQRARHVPGIDSHEAAQLELLESLAGYYSEMPFTREPSPEQRYYFDNPYFGAGDAIALYGLLRQLRPARVVEIGCGFSSAVMLDTDERFLDRQTAFTFVDPYPERLLSLMRGDDRARSTLWTSPVQDVPPRAFAQLGAGDILFVDSSHVAKIGSDVVHLLTHVLPALADGVVVHFHDVRWPFEYPREWVEGGRAWNESYMLKAFLQYNSRFRILLFNSFLATHHRDQLARCVPLALDNPGGSLWLLKTGETTRAA